MHKKGENTPVGFCTRRVKPGQELLADLAGNVVRSLELCRSYEISLLCYILLYCCVVLSCSEPFLLACLTLDIRSIFSCVVLYWITICWSPLSWFCLPSQAWSSNKSSWTLQQILASLPSLARTHIWTSSVLNFRFILLWIIPTFDLTLHFIFHIWKFSEERVLHFQIFPDWFPDFLEKMAAHLSGCQ